MEHTNPHAKQQVPMHSVKVKLLCAANKWTVTGPTFFQKTTNSEWYIHDIFNPLSKEMTDEERQYGYFSKTMLPHIPAAKPMTVIYGV
jgi:hypothetical protein